MATNYKKGFTLIEATVVMILIGIITTVCLTSLKSNNVELDVLNKAGAEMHNQLALALSSTLSKYSLTGRLDKLKTLDGASVFSISDSGAQSKFIDIYKTSLRRLRKVPTMTYDGFSDGMLLENGTFVAFDIYEDCEVDTETYNSRYSNPTEAIVEYDTCGAIFYDINQDEMPNILGLDRFIIAIDKSGIR